MPMTEVYACHQATHNEFTVVNTRCTWDTSTV